MGVLRDTSTAASPPTSNVTNLEVRPIILQPEYVTQVSVTEPAVVSQKPTSFHRTLACLHRHVRAF
jgi:hypothetical protein